MKEFITENEERLLRENIINIKAEVNPAMASYIRDAITILTTRSSPPCKLMITSGGGDVNVGLHIYDMIACYPSPVVGLVLGYACSMAAVILQACTRRLCLPHSRILIHHISRRNVNLDVMRSKRKLANVLEIMERDQKHLYRILAERSRKSISEIRKACARDEDMDAEEALAFGLIDEIVPLRPDITHDNKERAMIVPPV